MIAETLASQADRFVKRMKASPSLADVYRNEAGAWAASNISEIAEMLKAGEQANVEIGRLKKIAYSGNRTYKEIAEILEAKVQRRTEPHHEQLREFAVDVIDFGLRADLTPTRNFDHDAVVEWAWWSDYVRDAENRLRQAAKNALGWRDHE